MSAEERLKALELAVKWVGSDGLDSTIDAANCFYTYLTQDEEIDLDSDPGVPGGTAWDINTLTYPVKYRLTVSSLTDEHRDRVWQDSYGCRWRWYGYEDGHWEWRMPPNVEWQEVAWYPNATIGPYTSVGAQ